MDVQCEGMAARKRSEKSKRKELIERARSRKLWHDMIAYVHGYGT